MFRNAAEIRNDLVHNLLKHYWSAGPRGGYQRRCYQTCTNKHKKKVSTENIETTMSKYQSQVNQANYLEHMTVQNVLFA